MTSSKDDIILFLESRSCRGRLSVEISISTSLFFFGKSRRKVGLFHLQARSERNLYFSLLRCPKKSSGLRCSSIFSTAATHSPRSSRHRRRSGRFPLSSFLGTRSPFVTVYICFGRLRRRRVGQTLTPHRQITVSACRTPPFQDKNICLR